MQDLFENTIYSPKTEKVIMDTLTSGDYTYEQAMNIGLRTSFMHTIGDQFTPGRENNYYYNPLRDLGEVRPKLINQPSGKHSARRDSKSAYSVGGYKTGFKKSEKKAFAKAAKKHNLATNNKKYAESSKKAKKAYNTVKKAAKNKYVKKAINVAKKTSIGRAAKLAKNLFKAVKGNKKKKK